jgi:hypothetical protein
MPRLFRGRILALEGLPENSRETISYRGNRQPASSGINGGVFCTDALENAFGPSVKAARCISAEDIDFIRQGYLAPQLFEPNSGVHFALRPQQSSAFPTNSNAGILWLSRFGG